LHYFAAVSFVHQPGILRASATATTGTLERDGCASRWHRSATRGLSSGSRRRRWGP